MDALLDRTSVEEVLGSFYALFRIPIRILNATGGSFARTRNSSPFNEYLATLSRAAQRLRDVQSSLRQREPGDAGEFLQATFSGASYYVSLIGHDGRGIGRFILGPFITPEMADLPSSLLECDSGLDAAHARELLLALPRVRGETIRAIARHLAVTLDVLIFASHKAVLTEYMHLSTVQENQRQLSLESERLMALEARLAHTERVRSDFISALCNEWSLPLSEIVSEAERLVTTHPGEPRVVASSIRENAERLLGLARHWVDAWSVESSLVPTREQVDVRALLERVCHQLRATTLARGPELRVECAANMPRPSVDAARLTWVLVRLGEKALRSASSGPIQLEAHCIAEPLSESEDDSCALALFGSPKQVVEFRIRDLAPSVTDSPRAAAFEAPAQTLADEQEPSGWGPGLAAVRRVIEAHQGRLRVEDNRSGGAVFIVTVPLPGEAG